MPDNRLGSQTLLTSKHQESHTECVGSCKLRTCSCKGVKGPFSNKAFMGWTFALTNKRTAPGKGYEEGQEVGMFTGSGLRYGKSSGGFIALVSGTYSW